MRRVAVPARRHALGAPVVVLMLSALMLSACVHQGGAPGPEGDTTTITEDQIEKLHATTAYDVVARTHGDFLVSRGRVSTDPSVPATPPDVYLDEAYYGDVSRLRDIPASDIAAIRLYQAYEAQYKFGTGHLGGVIQVITKH